MATHADNKIYGNTIRDSVINIDSINNVDGVNPEAIINYLPQEHDLTPQIVADPTIFEFVLDPPVAPSTERFFELFLDGQRLNRGFTPDQPDYYLYPNRIRVSLSQDFHLDENSQLVAIYIEAQTI
jgi:hypothetical protein